MKLLLSTLLLWSSQNAVAFVSPARSYHRQVVSSPSVLTTRSPPSRIVAWASSSTDEDQEDQEVLNNRRRLMLGATGALPVFLQSAHAAPAVQAPSVTKPLADLPMVRLKLPQGGVGRDYVAVQLMIGGQGPFDFMVDSGLTTELITPHLQQSLGLAPGRFSRQGIGAGGSAGTQGMVTLKDAALCTGGSKGGGSECLKLPPLTAIVTDFPQEHMDPRHNVEGMLGMELLQLFDVDFDFAKGRLRLWKPGTAAAVAKQAGLIEIPAAVLNETLLLGIRVTSPGAGSAQPIVGILDCGSTFSSVNWAGAELLGLPPQSDRAFYEKGPKSVALGVDGRPLYIPLKQLQFTFAGDLDPATRTFQPPPKSWKPWKPVLAGVGDLPVFSQALGDGRTPYTGPAALIGQDVISQRRVILETASSGRQRRVFMSPS